MMLHSRTRIEWLIHFGVRRNECRGTGVLSSFMVFRRCTQGLQRGRAIRPPSFTQEQVVNSADVGRIQRFGERDV